MLYDMIRPFLFRIPAEDTHCLTLKLLAKTYNLRKMTKLFQQPIELPTNVMGLHFPNPIGLAAGMDTNGDYIDALGSLGFGSVELGTVTPKAQFGNPKPRLFRLPKAEGIINRMGFNNKSVDYLVEQLSDYQYPGVLGVNIGKNKDTPLAQAAQDYLYGLRKVYRLAGYVVVNCSSPNTPDLRQLQFGEYFDHLLKTLKQEQQRLTDQYCRYVPLVLKIAPDMDDESMKALTQQLLTYQIDGVIACNTTIDRSKVQGLTHAEEKGGLSGRPLQAQSLHMLDLIKSLVGSDMAVISVGGIMSSEDVVTRFQKGADLVQLYSGLIYRGPSLIRESLKKLAASPSKLATVQ